MTPSFATFPGLLLGATILAGSALRFFTTSDLWLDEALSVNIAALELGELRGALLQDGAPPLYYVLLHGWMQVFGSSDFAVRAFSGVCSVATIPLVWLAVRERQRTAAAALLLVASSPFAIRYATEARMYSLVALLVAGGYLLLRRALDRPDFLRLIPLMVVAGLLPLTHYWGLFLIGAGVVVLLAAHRRGVPATAPVAGAVAAGLLFFLPWVPTFLEQARTTGTPWAQRAPVSGVAHAISAWAGSPSGAAPILTVVFIALLVLALWGLRRADRIELRSPVPDALTGVLALVVFGTLGLAIAASLVSGSAYNDRYTAVVFPLFILVAARGAALLRGRWSSGLLTLTVLLGLITGAAAAVKERTQAGVIAAEITERAAPGDLVVLCPDQLGPAVNRLLPAGLDQLVFPTLASPERVDWRDYEERNRAAEPGAFADAVLERAGTDATIWFVWSTGYRTFGRRCEEVGDALAAQRRPDAIMSARASYYERANVTAFEP